MFTHLEYDPPHLQDAIIQGKRYYATPNDKVYPSITTILGSKPKPWLADWKNMLGQDKAKKETKRCSDRGTAIHDMSEMYLKNQLKTKGFAREHINGFNQLKFYLNRINNIHAQEVALFSDTLKVAGRVDCIGEYQGTLAVIDFKTSNNNKNESMIDDYFKQCTAYAIMWTEMTGKPIEDIVILMSVERGIMPLVFQDKIENWIEPLLQDIHNYYNIPGNNIHG